MDFRNQYAKHKLGFGKRCELANVFLKDKITPDQAKYCARDVGKKMWSRAIAQQLRMWKSA